MTDGALAESVNGSDHAWHARDVESVLATLASHRDTGLSQEEAERRLAVDGRNEIPDKAGRSLRAMVVAQLSDALVLALIGAAVLAAALGDVTDAVVILAIVTLDAVVGVAQDYRASRAVAALRSLAPNEATVVRAGRPHVIEAASLVPGDIVRIEAGDAVPADLRLIEAPRLQLDESALTGEAVPVEKQVSPLPESRAPLGDRTNLAFKGTHVTAGRASGIAVATGARTELGRIAALLASETPTQTPLQRNLARAGRQLALVIVAVCTLVFAAGLLRGEPFVVTLLTAISLAVAAIPEAMPAVVTVMLSIGARDMARRHALIRSLPAVETLGSVNVICTDKTGTLTLNRMQVAALFLDGRGQSPDEVDPVRPSNERLLRALALCNDAAVAAGDARGDPTEVALRDFVAARGLDQMRLLRDVPRLAEVPFDTQRRMMTTLHHLEGASVSYTKGAPEAVIARCVGSADFTSDWTADRVKALAAAEAMARAGLRVLALATRGWINTPDLGDMERDLSFIGLVGLKDPPRPAALGAVSRCREAGIRVIMITGDHPETARAIATELGIAHDASNVRSGVELHGLDGAALSACLDAVHVFARVEPAQKIRIVGALQERGDVVAMIGDGVNDAPALAKADIGVAMGRSGTDVAREAAGLVLLDDEFSTVVAAIAEGRRIFDNVRKFVSYILACNLAEVLTVALAPFLGLPAPLLPIQILWINLVTDGLPGLAMAAEPAEEGLMRRPPRPSREGVFTRRMWQHILIVGSAMACATLAAEAYTTSCNPDHWQTVVFTGLTLAQMVNALATRSESGSAFRQNPLANLSLLGAVTLTVVLQLCVVYLPWCNSIFHTAPLDAGDLAVCLILSGAVLAVSEAEKFVIRLQGQS